MRVRCTRILDPLGAPAESYPPLELGREYVVTHVTAAPHWPADLGILFEGEKRPKQWAAAAFETVSTRIPVNWVARIDADGWLALAPEAWLEPYFWDDLHGEGPDGSAGFFRVIDVYERELSIIVAQA